MRRLLLLVSLLLAMAPPALAATRTYSRATLATMDPRQLAAMLDTALARTGHTVDIAGLAVAVTHPALGPADDATVAAQIAGYVYNPTFGQPAEALALKGKAPTLRQWAQDARDEVLAWDGQTQVQRNAALKILIDRLGKLLDNLADVLHVEGLSGP